MNPPTFNKRIRNTAVAILLFILCVVLILSTPGQSYRSKPATRSVVNNDPGGGHFVSR